MIGLILIIIGIVVLFSLVPVSIPPLVVVMGPKGWQLKIPSGIVLIIFGIYLDYGASLMDMLGF